MQGQSKLAATNTQQIAAIEEARAREQRDRHPRTIGIPNPGIPHGQIRGGGSNVGGNFAPGNPGGRDRSRTPPREFCIDHQTQWIRLIRGIFHQQYPHTININPQNARDVPTIAATSSDRVALYGCYLYSWCIGKSAIAVSPWHAGKKPTDRHPITSYFRLLGILRRSMGDRMSADLHTIGAAILPEANRLQIPIPTTGDFEIQARPEDPYESGLINLEYYIQHGDVGPGSDQDPPGIPDQAMEAAEPQAPAAPADPAVPPAPPGPWVDRWFAAEDSYQRQDPIILKELLPMGLQLGYYKNKI